MSDPGLCVDGTILDQPDNSSEVSRQGVAAGEQRQFAAMHDRSVREADLVLRDANVSEPSGECAVFQRGRHRAIVPGRIDDDVAHAAVRQCCDVS